MPTDQDWIADLLAGYKQVNLSGQPLVRRNFLNLASGFSAVDNPSGNGGVGSTDLTVTTTPGALWTTLLDVDLTAQPTQSLATNGNYTIAGLTWTKANSAQDNTPMALTSGTGLVINPASSSDYHSTTKTLPYIWTPLSGIFGAAAFDWGTQLRIWVSLGADNCAAQYDLQATSLDVSPLAGNSDYWVNVFRGFNGSASTFSSMWNLAGVRTAIQSDNLVPGTSSKTFMYQFDRLAAGRVSVAYGAGLGAGVAFPALSTLQQGLQNCPASLFTLNPVSELVTSYGILLGAMRAGSPTNYVTTIQRWRVDYRN